MDYQNPELAFARNMRHPLAPVTVSREEIIEFATEFDPAFFHIDEEAAKSSLLGELIASGFHTCAIAMRMICDSYLLKSTSQGAPEVTELKWLAPVRPGDTLSGFTIVEDGRRSKSRDNLWISRLHHKIENQHGEQVLSMIVIALFAILECEA